VNIDLVVFDMAGTTVHDGDAVHACLQAALSSAGVKVDRDDVNAVMGLAKPAAIRSLLELRSGYGPIAAERVSSVHEDFLGRMLAHYRLDPGIRETAGATRVFRELRARGIKVALDTGFSRRVVDAILERLCWGHDVVDATVASDEVARGRPFPDLVYRAMVLTGVSDPRHVAKVGDTPADLEEGQAAGCGLVVGVTDGSHTRNELLRWPHTHLIDNVGQFPALLDGAVAVAG